MVRSEDDFYFNIVQSTSGVENENAASTISFEIRSNKSRNGHHNSGSGSGSVGSTDFTSRMRNRRPTFVPENVKKASGRAWVS